MTAQFYDPLQLEIVNDNESRPNFVTLRDFRYYTDVLPGLIIVPQGTPTDGPSVPQMAMSMVGYRGMRAAVVHDYLVRHPEMMPREQADLIFREALGVCGVPDADVGLMYAAVSGYTAQLRKQAAGPDLYEG